MSGGHYLAKNTTGLPSPGCKAKFERGKPDLFSQRMGWETPTSTTANMAVFANNAFAKPAPFIVRFRASANCKPSSDDIVIDSSPVDIPAGNVRTVSVQFPDRKRPILTAEIDAKNVVSESDETNNRLYSPEYYAACKQH